MSVKDPIAELIRRRHPSYERLLPHWDFVEATYEGGREWFKHNIFRYIKEGDSEYHDRVKRAYRFNHTRQVVDLVDKYLFKQQVVRREDAPDVLKRFWANTTLSGIDMDTFARRLSNATSRFGRVWVVVDSTYRTDGEDGVRTLADQLRSGGRPYAYIVRPQDMLDMGYDEFGELLWALVREVGRDDQDPILSSGDPIIRYRLWTRTNWTLIEERTSNAKRRRGSKLNPSPEIVDSGEHNLGIVPIVAADHQISDERYDAPGLIDDIAYLDRANANYLSNLDAIIQDQAFSQLVMPAQGVLPGEAGHEKLLEMGTKRIFTYNAEGGKAPEYISPDPRQASMILAAIGKIINEIYHSVGLSAERTKEDNGGGIDNASGVAKAYDFERVNALLTAKAKALQHVEHRIARLAALWEGETLNDGVLYVAYPEKFDVRSLYDEFEIAARLIVLAAPDEVRRRQMLTLIDKMFPGISDEERRAMERSVMDWPPEPVAAPSGLSGATSTAPDGANPVRAASAQRVAKELTA